MRIPEDHKWRYLFHFTEVRNLKSIIQNGLLCTNLKNKKGIKHIDIANSNIQERRSRMRVPVGPGGRVHDYVPFYFSSINPMLLTLLMQKNIDQNNIIYLCLKIQRLEEEDAVFTDASANTVSPPDFFEDTSDLDKLDWELIDSRKWRVETDEQKHKKMAEALIHKRVGIEEIDAIVVFNEDAKEFVETVFRACDVPSPSIIYDFDPKVKKYAFYYTKFFLKDNDRKLETLVTGPQALLDEYEELLDSIHEKRLVPRMRPYPTISEMVKAIGRDFSVLPELGNVVGLQQEYGPHNDSVDDHTLTVVECMKKIPYYKESSDELKSALLLAAYLHDIGKGPKDKWDDGKMKRPYPDHPVDAIPMLERILSEEVDHLSDDEIRWVCMMVVYHDLIGECMMKDRSITQILPVIKGLDDLEMLFAISIADASAIDRQWGDNIIDGKDDFIDKVSILTGGDL